MVDLKRWSANFEERDSIERIKVPIDSIERIKAPIYLPAILALESLLESHAI